MTQLAFVLLAAIAGVAAATQGAANAGLAQRIGLGAALVVNTMIVLAGALAFFFARGAHASFFPPGTPASLYVGGLCGFAIILCMAVAMPKLGAAWTIALMVLGQTAAALAIDHFGLLGLPRDPLTLSRVAGLALVAACVAVARL
jgi:transporter family-2 protein